jgi:hypothetical protein
MSALQNFLIAAPAITIPIVSLLHFAFTGAISDCSPWLVRVWAVLGASLTMADHVMDRGWQLTNG